MRIFLIISLVFVSLAIGLPSDASAQASASVGYTIVVSEDALASNNSPNPRGSMPEFQEDRETRETLEDRMTNSTSLSVSMEREDAEAHGDYQQSFETELNPANSHNIRHAFEQSADAPTSANAPVLAEEIKQEDDAEYRVVMEFN
ncbi:MAG: hypothetical protein R6U62_06785 [Bacteroidales bacterium]